jgi:hypothetical protein
MSEWPAFIKDERRPFDRDDCRILNGEQHPEADVGYVRKSHLGLGFQNAEKLGEIVAETLPAFRPRPNSDPLALERVRATGAGGTFYTLLMCIDGQ